MASYDSLYGTSMPELTRTVQPSNLSMLASLYRAGLPASEIEPAGEGPAVDAFSDSKDEQ